MFYLALSVIATNVCMVLHSMMSRTVSDNVSSKGHIVDMSCGSSCFLALKILVCCPCENHVQFDAKFKYQGYQ